jgi:hypothetical protein
MRTKSILFAAALAASAVPAVAQNVYSLNVVGYVNVVIPPGGVYSCLANPLDAGDNTVTNLFSSNIPDGSTVLTWNTAVADFDGVSPTYSSFLKTWDSNTTLKPGSGFFFINPSATAITNTFVGTVFQGTTTTALTGNGVYNLVGSIDPIGGSFTNSIAGLTAADGDTVATWNVATQDFDGVSPTYSAFLKTWSDPANVPVGTGFFYIRAGSDLTWVRSFTVN